MMPISERKEAKSENREMGRRKKDNGKKQHENNSAQKLAFEGVPAFFFFVVGVCNNGAKPCQHAWCLPDMLGVLMLCRCAAPFHDYTIIEEKERSHSDNQTMRRRDTTC